MHNEADGNTANDAAPTIVRIAYRSFGKPVPDNRPECGCVYYWPFREPPGPGQWVTVPGSRPEIYAIVTGFGNKGDANGTPIKTIASVVPDELVAEEQRKTDADMVAWLWVAQRAAGFPAPGYPAPPDAYPYSPIPPATGTAPSADVASEYGSVWERVQRGAEEYGLPLEQVKRFKSISERWLAISRSRPSETDPTSKSSDTTSGREITGATDTTATASSSSRWKWLLILVGVVLVLVVLTALIRSRGHHMNPNLDDWWPTSSLPTTLQPYSRCYRNVNGECVPSPSASSTLPGRATAECRDGTYSFSSHRSGSCAGHGGVAVWLDGPA